LDFIIIIIDYIDNNQAIHPAISPEALDKLTNKVLHNSPIFIKNEMMIEHPMVSLL